MSDVHTSAAPRRIADLPSPPTLPLLGNLHQLRIPRLHRIMEDWAESLGTPYRYRIGPKVMTVWRDSAMFQTVLRERPHRWRRFDTIEPVFSEIGANGLFSVEGKAWEPQRRLVMQALASSHFRGFFPVLQEITGRLCKRWEGAALTATPVDMNRDLKRYAVDVASALAFGEDPNTIERGSAVIQDHLGEIFPMLMSRVNSPISYWRYVRLPRDRRLDQALVAVHRYVDETIRRARERIRDEPSEVPRNLLEAMLTLRDAPGSGVTDDVIHANVLTLLLAGEDTTANMLAWTMPFLCADAALQARLHDQAREVFGDSPVCPTFEDLRRLDRFEALATEASRLRPTVPFNTFEPLEPVTLGGVALPAGVKVVFLKRPDMLDERHFANALTYDPERWLRPPAGREAGTHEPRAYLQFGAGARVCPGRHLAGVEIRLVLSMLARNFKSTLAMDPDDIREVMAFTMTPERMPVRLESRAGGNLPATPGGPPAVPARQ